MFLLDSDNFLILMTGQLNEKLSRFILIKTSKAYYNEYLSNIVNLFTYVD